MGWKRIACLVALLLSLTAGVPGAAEPFPLPGGFSSDNVEYLGHIPFNYDSPGARIKGRYLYLTTSRDLRIFDISKPVDPQLVGSLLYPQTVYFAQEDVDTNGKILLVGDSVVDVEDKTNPRLIGENTTSGHTITCVLDCTWGYSASGRITDLRQPAAPKQVDSTWTHGTPAPNAHDVTEVARGIVVTSSNPITLLDARKDPAHPELLAVAVKGIGGRFIHSNLWPRRTKDRFLLVGGESGGPTCSSDSAVFMTFDARSWKSEGRLRPLDEYRLANGLPTEGKAAANLFCTHWFETRPGFHNGGVVSLAWYEHGSRFLRIKSNGDIEEIGWFVPYGGSTSATYWATENIVYAVDYNRGLDILRFKD